MIDVTSMGGSYEPDPGWSYADPQGHVHTHISDSWEWVFDGPEFYFDVDGEEWNGDGHYECLHCRALVEPKYQYKPPSSFREVMPGMCSYWIELAGGEHIDITEEEYAHCVNRWKESA